MGGLFQRIIGMTTGKTGQRLEAIDLLKVLLTIGIVFRHAELVGLEGRSAAFDVLSRGMMMVTSICVPLFFVLSGFLYFYNVPEHPDAHYFWNKTRKRFSSLLVPYLIANVFAFLCYWAAYRYAPQMMSGFFGEDWRKPLFIFWTGPVNMSLWFIRDLIIACLVAPLFYLLVRYTRIWGLLVLGAVWIFVGGSHWYNIWFAIGAWAAVCQGDTVARWLGRIHCRVPADAAAWCFFIYLYHYILVIALKKWMTALLDPSSFWVLLGVYLTAAIVTLAVLSGLFQLMKTLLPKTTGILVGGKL